MLFGTGSYCNVPLFTYRGCENSEATSSYFIQMLRRLEENQDTVLPIE
jgi:hypothetical protein